MWRVSLETRPLDNKGRRGHEYHDTRRALCIVLWASVVVIVYHRHSIIGIHSVPGRWMYKKGKNLKREKNKNGDRASRTSATKILSSAVCHLRCRGTLITGALHFLHIAESLRVPCTGTNAGTTTAVLLL